MEQGANRKGKVIYAGVDYHKNSFTVACLDRLTGVLSTRKYKAEEIRNHVEELVYVNTSRFKHILIGGDNG
jgi:hypothetical protein